MADKDFVIKNGLVVGDTATINGVQIDPSGVVSGQVLKFDGTKFAPAAEGDISGTVYSTTIGDGTNSSYTITHGFGTRNVVVVIRNATSPYEVINARWEATTTNSITVDFSSAISSDSIVVSVYSTVTGISTGSSYYQNIGNGTDSSFTLTHNFNTRDVVVTARNVSSPYEVINVRWEAETANTVVVDFSSAPSSNSVRIGVYATVSGTAVTLLDDISDVAISAAATNQVLSYNGSAWVNTSNPTIAGNLAVSGTTTVSNYINRVTASGNSSWLQQDGTGRVHWYWNTLGGTSPVFTNANEDASSITQHVTLNGSGGAVFFRSANGASATAGSAISWTTTLYADLTTFSYKGNNIVHAGSTGVVTSTMIADNTIVNGDINSSAAIAHSKLANATAGQVLLGATTTGVVTATTISGDITIDGAGVATIAANSVALGTDTTGNYVSSLVAGTGITLANNAGEGATPTVTVNTSVIAPLASPSLTGVPLAPTAANTTNNTQIATTAYVKTVINDLINSAPATLDTLGEIATSLANNASLSSSLTSSIALKAPLADPTFTGTVTIPAGASISGFAPLASPTFTGTPTLPTGTIATTQTAGNNTTAVATTAFVTTADNLKANLASPTFTGTVIASNLTVNGSLKITTALEIASVSATAATGTINIDFLSNPVVYYTANATANWTLNVRGNSSTTMNTVMSTGDVATVTFMAQQGATAYYPTVYQIDGTAVTPKWQGGTAPTSGNASSIDTYALTIVKTAANTYTMFASQTRFA